MCGNSEILLLISGTHLQDYSSTMKQSKLHIKTLKEDPKGEVSLNAKLLIRAGFIDKTMAGVYTFLPLGLRVLNKIEAIVREEMDKVGNEIFMPAIVPKDLWAKTGRLEKVDVLMKTMGANEASLAKNDAEYILNSTHEEVMMPIAQKNALSYKDLPAAYYQIQTKFRNEPRAKSGLLRGREFRMKDLYTFHASEEDMQEYYDAVLERYHAVFERLGIGEDTRIALASGGDFTDHFSHEFQTKCENGEDEIFYDAKTDTAFNKEITPSKASEFNQGDEAEAEMEDVIGEGIIGVKDLAAHLNIPVEKTTKTILFEADNGRVIAAALRGDYEINEIKLKKILKTAKLELLAEEKVKEVTGAEVGYAGLLNLPENVEVYMDDSMQGRINFEMGANKTDYHTININFGRDMELPEAFHDFKMAKEGDMHPESGDTYKVYAASEVGNTYMYYTDYSEAFGYTFLDKDGKAQTPFMASYGIGPSRVMGVIAEKFNDENGVIWPKQIAPFDIHLVGLHLDDENVQAKTEELYVQLTEAGYEVLFDDRDISPGQKFAESDLFGIPLRLVMSRKMLEQDAVEWKERSGGEAEMVSFEELSSKIEQFMA